MPEVRTLTGNYAAAHAAKLARVQVGLFFPIGPADEVMETVQELIDAGEMKDAEVLQLENEKSVLSTQIALARLGVRTMFSTCAEGLLWAMAEIRYASASRLPLLIVNPSRAISPPTTVYCDHDDFMIHRDMGWLMFYCEDPQDVLDTVLQAYKVAEDKEVLLPAIVGYDGYGGVSHASYRVTLPDQGKVDAFLPQRTLKPDKDYALIDWRARFQQRRHQQVRGHYMDKKYVMVKALEDAKGVIDRVGQEYKAAFGSDNAGRLKTYHCQDAELIIVTMGANTSTARFVVNALRDEGLKVGLVKLRVFRPFPRQELAAAISGAKVVITLERSSLEALFTETRSALYGDGARGRPLIMGRVVGIGGRDVSQQDIAGIVAEGLQAGKTGKIEKELEWTPIKGLDFDPFEEDVGE